MKSKWNIVPLRNLIGFISKGIAPAYAEDETETTIRVLNQKCNRNFQISYSESRLHDVSKKRVPSERYVKQNDIIINSTGKQNGKIVVKSKGAESPQIQRFWKVTINQNICRT